MQGNGIGEGRAWGSFLSRIGIIANTATLYGRWGELVCFIRPSRFGSNGTIYMHGVENRVPYRFCNGMWFVVIRNVFLVAQRSGNQILVVSDTNFRVRVFRMYALYSSRSSEFVVREVLSIHDPFSDGPTNPICLHFGGDSWVHPMRRWIDNETYAFIFFIYVIVVRRRRRRVLCCTNRSL